MKIIQIYHSLMWLIALIYSSVSVRAVFHTLDKVHQHDSAFRNYRSASECQRQFISYGTLRYSTRVNVCSRWECWRVKSICASAPRTPPLTTYTCTYKPLEHRLWFGSALPSCSSLRTDTRPHPRDLTMRSCTCEREMWVCRNLHSTYSKILLYLVVYSIS